MPVSTRVTRVITLARKQDDRNLSELVQELRVAGLGIQVLFGFLLALPFAQGFRRLSGPERDLYLTCVVLSAVAVALLVGTRWTRKKPCYLSSGRPSLRRRAGPGRRPWPGLTLVNSRISILANIDIVTYRFSCDRQRSTPRQALRAGGPQA
ncbi:MAG: DUF6328 family protein [Trebonia sp.]